jgi:GntR family transcriptional regulator
MIHPGSPVRPQPAVWASSKPRAELARRVADVLRRRIAAEEFDGGSGLLPDELLLARQFGASRNAMREALRLLQDEGLVTRRRGVGTAVVTPRYGHGLDRLAGLGEALAGHGTVTNEVLSAEVVTGVPEAITARLGLADASPVVHIERLRRLNGLPLSLDSSYLRTDVGSVVIESDLVGRDVFALIEEATGERLDRAELSVRAVNADPYTAALLGIPPATAIFAIERLTRLADGRPVDTESLRVRADRFTLHATVYRGRSTSADAAEPRAESER